jgi:hypothetical protein
MADMSAAMTDISVNRPRVVEHDAREIGGLFRKAKSSAVESVRCLIQAGHKLKAKQKSCHAVNGFRGWKRMSGPSASARERRSS